MVGKRQIRLLGNRKRRKVHGRKKEEESCMVGTRINLHDSKKEESCMVGKRKRRQAHGRKKKEKTGT